MTAINGLPFISKTTGAQGTQGTQRTSSVDIPMTNPSVDRPGDNYEGSKHTAASLEFTADWSNFEQTANRDGNFLYSDDMSRMGYVY